MAQTVDTGGGLGGGSASSVCIPSPSDQAQIIDNLINRIKLLEDAVTMLLAQNISVGQISELSEQIGWVGNVTYMGIPGWTQTEYGTLIPPPGFSLSTSGFTMSDGSTFPAVVMDSDGVLQFGFGGQDADGNALPVSGAAVSGNDILVLVFTPQSLLFNEKITYNSAAFSNGSSITWSGDTVTMLAPGSYLVELLIDTASWDTTPTGTDTLYMRIATDESAGKFPFFQFPSDGLSSPLPDTKTAVIHKATGDTQTMTIAMRNNTGEITIGGAVVIVKLGAT